MVAAEGLGEARLRRTGRGLGDGWAREDAAAGASTTTIHISSDQVDDAPVRWRVGASVDGANRNLRMKTRSRVGHGGIPRIGPRISMIRSGPAPQMGQS